jgi:hypothetical protein
MAFKIPLQSEVQGYIKEKKNWPEKFCKFYAERFWNFYQSNGWKVSGKAAMKDWKAAFNGQWQTLKFKEDIDMLNACMRSEKETVGTAPGPNTDRTLAYMDEVMAYYQKNHFEVEDVRLASCYDTLKEYGLMRLSKEESQLVKTTYGSDVVKGKASCVRILFDKLTNQGINLTQLNAKAKPVP